MNIERVTPKWLGAKQLLRPGNIWFRNASELGEEERIGQHITACLLAYLSQPRCLQCVSIADELFAQWQCAADAHAIALGPTFSVICDGHYFKAIDQRYRRRHGWARHNYRRALKLWGTIHSVPAAQGQCSECLRCRLGPPCLMQSGGGDDR